MSVISVTSKTRFISEMFANSDLFYKEGESPEEMNQKTEEIKKLGSVISVEHSSSHSNQLDVTESERALLNQLYKEDQRASQRLLEFTRGFTEKAERQRLDRENAKNKRSKSRKHHRKRK